MSEVELETIESYEEYIKEKNNKTSVYVKGMGKLQAYAGLEHIDWVLHNKYYNNEFEDSYVAIKSYITSKEKENKQLKERIDKADKDIQKLLDDINTKTIIGLNSFIPRLEVIQDELVGDNNE